MGVAQQGVIQPVEVLATEQVVAVAERASFRGALEALAGHDLGSHVGAWRRWWEANRARLLAARAQRFSP